MLGAIIGDVAGSFREFSVDKYAQLPLLPHPTQVKNGRRYGMTDDSALTLATYAAFQGEPITSAEAFRQEYYHGGKMFEDVGYGLQFHRWLTGTYSCAQPYNSCGNGSAMRVSPVGWYAKDFGDCLRLATLSAAPTHNHPEGIKGAQFVALMVFLYLHKDPNPEETILQRTGIQYSRAKQYDHFDKICQETIPLALNVLDQATDYESAVKAAVTIPRADSDTLGAIVGAIAEARWGLPDRLVQTFLNEEDFNLVHRSGRSILKHMLDTHYPKYSSLLKVELDPLFGC